MVQELVFLRGKYCPLDMLNMVGPRPVNSLNGKSVHAVAVSNAKERACKLLCSDTARQLRNLSALEVRVWLITSNSILCCLSVENDERDMWRL